MNGRVMERGADVLANQRLDNPIAIDQHGPRADVLDDVDRSRKGKRGGDHLVARLDTERYQAEEQPGGAAPPRGRASRRRPSA